MPHIALDGLCGAGIILTGRASAAFTSATAHANTVIEAGTAGGAEIDAKLAGREAIFRLGIGAQITVFGRRAHHYPPQCRIRLPASRILNVARDLARKSPQTISVTKWGL